MQKFDYLRAFARNVGWVTPSEQERLATAKVAIAGLGGVGGTHLLTLCRLGVGRFSLAELDQFEQENFNRQVGAMMSSLERPKIDTLVEMARDVNPELELSLLPSGLSTESLDAFLEGVDVYVDGLDFFAFEIRAAVFEACRRKGIPAVTAAPLGMSSALLVFKPGGMPFEDYFRLNESTDDIDRALRFLIGLAPAMMHRHYLVWPEAVDLAERRGPSTMIACQLCAGMAAGATLKLILGRGSVPAAPWSFQFDAYRNRFRRSWSPGGNRNPLMRMKRAIARRIVAGREEA
ncbi:MAG: ThiF family adenylyltransferase [Rhodocyclaceae bacterium]|nr:ThiF family adenylyltransferase [Rhodocyclaceae bacterium]